MGDAPWCLTLCAFLDGLTDNMRQLSPLSTTNSTSHLDREESCRIFPHRQTTYTSTLARKIMMTRRGEEGRMPAHKSPPLTLNPFLQSRFGRKIRLTFLSCDCIPGIYCSRTRFYWIGSSQRCGNSRIKHHGIQFMQCNRCYDHVDLFDSFSQSIAKNLLYNSYSLDSPHHNAVLEVSTKLHKEGLEQWCI